MAVTKIGITRHLYSDRRQVLCYGGCRLQILVSAASLLSSARLLMRVIEKTVILSYFPTQSPGMSPHRFERIERAELLPDKWNELTECFFQQKEFLHHAELYNPCNQHYYLLWKDNVLLAGACFYKLPIHLFTFSGIPSRLPMQVMGLPASVSAPGLIGRSKDNIEQLIQYTLKTEKGLLLGLNLPPGLRMVPAIEMTMMPGVVLIRQLPSWEDYLDTLRSPYRRRAMQILQSFQGVTSVSTGCNSFTTAHYQLYLQIMKRTKNKLETLSLDFFINLPSNFRLCSYYTGDVLICWHITCSDQNQLFFFFGGHDYGLLNQYQLYFNNLFGILKQFIADGYQKLDLGQTAEIAKMKAGGQLQPKVLFLYHRNAFVQLLLRLFKPFISYHPPELSVHIFKNLHAVHQIKSANNENTIRQAAAIT